MITQFIDPQIFQKLKKYFQTKFQFAQERGKRDFLTDECSYLWNEFSAPNVIFLLIDTEIKMKGKFSVLKNTWGVLQQSFAGFIWKTFSAFSFSVSGKKLICYQQKCCCDDTPANMLKSLFSSVYHFENNFPAFRFLFILSLDSTHHHEGKSCAQAQWSIIC